MKLNLCLFLLFCLLLLLPTPGLWAEDFSIEEDFSIYGDDDQVDDQADLQKFLGKARQAAKKWEFSSAEEWLEKAKKLGVASMKQQLEATAQLIQREKRAQQRQEEERRLARQREEEQARREQEQAAQNHESGSRTRRTGSYKPTPGMFPARDSVQTTYHVNCDEGGYGYAFIQDSSRDVFCFGNIDVPSTKWTCITKWEGGLERALRLSCGAPP